MQGLVGLLHTEMVYPPEDGHRPGTNRARCVLTSFMRRTPLTSGAARGAKGEASPPMANLLKSYRTKPYKFPMHCSKCVSFWGLRSIPLLSGFLFFLCSLTRCLAPAPLKLRNYGAIQICLLLLLLLPTWLPAS